MKPHQPDQPDYGLWEKMADLAKQVKIEIDGERLYLRGAVRDGDCQGYQVGGGSFGPPSSAQENLRMEYVRVAVDGVELWYRR